MVPQETKDLLEIVSLDAWERRKEFVNFDSADEEILRELRLVAQAYADDVVNELYERLLKFAKVRQFFPDGATIARVKAMQRDQFVSLTGGKYGPDYLVSRLRVGLVHKRIGLTPDFFMGAYTIYLEIVIPRVLRAFEYDRVKQARAVTALVKLFNLDQELALATYFHEGNGR